MNFADVAVNSPIAQRRSFCYSIPADLNIQVGHAVWVPFGSKTLQGIVVKVADFPSFDETKEITGLISSVPLLSVAQVGAALWMNKHYLASLFDSVALMLPPGFERRLLTYLSLLPSAAAAKLEPAEGGLVSIIKGRDEVNLRDLEKKFGKRKATNLTRQLVQRGLVQKIERLEQPKIKTKIVSYLMLRTDEEFARAEIARLRAAGKNKEASVLEVLTTQKGKAPLAEVRKSTKSSNKTIEHLCQSSLVSVEDVPVRRDPLAHIKIVPSTPPALTPAQEQVWQRINGSLLITGADSPAVFLLRGVTGSGKTEIYLRALTEVVAKGKKGICLVPEIALTPQTIERFASRFPGRVAVLHSGLTPGEQYDEWYRIKQGDCDVVIGPRSALFAPQPDLGLIIIDEEHEWTYKQSDRAPRYHAREAAVKLAELSQAAVILGSATPDLETYYRAQRGDYRLIELEERITPYGPAPLPEVTIVDMKEELKAGNRSLFSRLLTDQMTGVLGRGEQVILFLNRRGAATFVQCRKCGFVFDCPRCSAALTYHSATRKLVCHHCNFSVAVPVECPQCKGQDLRFMGIGTQRVEEEVKTMFPGARLLRWDSDMAARRHGHEELLNKIRAREVDVIIGTQMIAKGLDLPQVTLAGVISADMGLNLPDFKASERTFQLLCQVAGRAGRGFMPGKVIIQTYSPEHYAIQAAARHDYKAFYEKEIEYRRQFGYPPFSELASLAFNHSSEQACVKEVGRMERLINEEKNRRGLPDIRTIGPMPAFVPRLRGYYRWQLVVCGHGLDDFLADIPLPRGWVLDIDPVSMV